MANTLQGGLERLADKWATDYDNYLKGLPHIYRTPFTCAKELEAELAKLRPKVERLIGTGNAYHKAVIEWMDNRPDDEQGTRPERNRFHKIYELALKAAEKAWDAAKADFEEGNE